jgi:hypothetical protein
LGKPVSTNDDVPALDQLLDVGMFVNTAVVQDNNGVRCWIWFHIVEEDTNEFRECCHAKRALKDIAMQNTAL